MVVPEKLYVSPDCGFFQLPRWITYLKLEALVAGAKIVRKELGARDWGLGSGYPLRASRAAAGVAVQ